MGRGRVRGKGNDEDGDIRRERRREDTEYRRTVKM